MLRKYYISFVLSIFVVGALAGGYWLYDQSQWSEFSMEDPKIFMNYPRDIVLDANSSEAGALLGKTELLFRGERIGREPFLINLRKETGLRLVSSLTKSDVMESLLGNVERAFPLRYPGLTGLSTRKMIVDGKEAGELLFSHVSKSGEKIRQRMLIIKIDADTVLYLSIQAKDEDFVDLDKKYFDRIFASIKFDD